LSAILKVYKKCITRSNYTPFVGFQEISDLTRHQDFLSLFSEYTLNLEVKTSLEDFLADLEGYASDVERMFFARTLLKIAFAADIILPIRSATPALQTEWETAHQRWLDFLDRAVPSPSTCYLKSFTPLIGTAPT
jgi:hypothetical protein